jgi:hypothetical protein
MAERNLDSSGEESNIKRKVFNIMVEALQNIVKHSSEANAQAGNLVSQSAIFMIGKQPNQYSIMTGNPIKKSATAALKKNLDDLNQLDKDGLKEMYKEVIKNTQISEKGGAGLGFVDMARKSGEPLQFDFPEIDAEYNFFCLKVNVSREV